MIAFLKGKFDFVSPTIVQVEVNGVGYEVLVSLNTYDRIRNQSEGLLYTHLQVREDAHVLFGFAEQAEKEIFLMLIGVSGIGAGTARMMLSYMKPEELAQAIAAGKSAQLERIKGIGKKTAERVVLELRDKMARLPQESNIPALKSNTLQADALNALTALGINRQTAEQALRKVSEAEPGLALEVLVKKVLRTL